MLGYIAIRMKPTGIGLALVAGLVAVSLHPSYAFAPVTDPIIRIEEDWQLVLNEPDNEWVSPQFATVMSPYPHMDSYYAQTLWNYRETPDFTPGGIQLQSYRGEELIRTRNVESRVLSSVAEEITWTQSLETNGRTLTFSIYDGRSTTWHEFGRDMNISSTANVSDLSQYDPAFSAANACVTFGSNRVNQLVLTRVRYYGESGLLAEDDTPRYACGSE